MSSLPTRKAYQWVASLYFFQSMPFVIVSLIATMLYQQQGLSNARAALLTSLLALPWASRPCLLLFEKFSTKKQLTVLMQFFVALLFFVLALSIHKNHFIIISLLGLTGLAFVSSIHDIVSDGLYLLNLDNEQQKRYVALRSFFIKWGVFVIKGGLLVAVGYLATRYQLNIWTLFFYSLSVLALLLAVYHRLKIPEGEISSRHNRENYCLIFKKLYSEKQIYLIFLFIFIYNFTEAQLQKIVPLFLLDHSGLNLSLSSVGEIYGAFGSLALMLGIFVSGFLITRFTIAYCLQALTFLLVLSHVLLLLLAYNLTPTYLIFAIILFNQFAFGLANGAYMGYLLSVANKSSYPMSMYTMCTAVMALSYVLFGALSGLTEQLLGYSGFFLYVAMADSLLIVFTYKMMNNYA